jgi:hypothetical protein
MKRVIPVSLLVFWAMQFALQLIAAIKGMPLAMFSPFDNQELLSLTLTESSALPLLAVASGLIAALFIWAGITVATAHRHAPDQARDTTRTAFSAAMIAITFLTALSAVKGVFVPFEPVAIIMAALAISWLVSLRELDRESEEIEDFADSRNVAKRMAGEAAHKAVLGALTGRPKTRAGGKA